jgi:deazaflavin-dependent oxidoreductase (nitroreductase family)
MSEMQDFNKRIIEEFRANDGIVGPPFAGATLLLLTTRGAKSGDERINPLVYFGEDDRVFVFASAGGSPRHPDWYHNLVANPDVTVEIGTRKIAARAVDVPDPERTRIYSAQAARSPQFAEYAANTTRTIPVVEIIPA